MPTKKTGSQVAAKLAVPAEVRPLLKDIESKKLLGGTSIDFYVKTAEEDIASDDAVLVKLGADKLRHLATLVHSAAARKSAEASDWHSEKQIALAQRKAEGADPFDPAVPDAEIASFDRKAQDAENQAHALMGFSETLRQAGQAAAPANWTGGGPAKASGEPHVFADPGVDVEEAEEVADMAAAEKLLKKARKTIDKLGPTTEERNPGLAATAAAQATVASALQHRGSPANPMRVQMERAENPNTPDTALWLKIRRASIDLGWDKYSAFMDALFASGDPSGEKLPSSRLRLPFPDVDPYRFLKAATEVFMMVNCDTIPAPGSGQNPAFNRVWTAKERQPEPGSPFSEADEDLGYAQRRLGLSFTADQIEKAWQAYLMPPSPPAPGNNLRILPYLALVRSKLGDQSISAPGNPEDGKAVLACSGILRNKLASPCLIELLWSYWHEEGMLVQTMNAISRRFQNIRGPGDRDPLAGIQIDPLRPLGNVLWGYIQDEQHRLTVVRRAYEYDHQYGLSLVGKAVPPVKGADSRTRFLEAFHNLLHLCTIFFKEDDDTTVIADGFPILNALRDLHLVLSQGAHNQYGDLPWTARQEMLIQEWILARPEMREFIPTRIMVAYPEPWEDRVDAMKTLMGWTDTSALHFSELGTYGERILLGARFNDWSTVIEPERAANWARFWRPEVQSYIHAYRAATGIDLGDRPRADMPSALLRQRLASQRVAVAR